MEPEFASEDFLFCSLGGGGRYFSILRKCFFPGFGGPDRSFFWPDVRRDIGPKTSSLG